MQINKAVIPVAGFGSRLLPATKALPKEMFPLVDKPVIHHVVEEAVNAGITDIALITSHRKQSIENYFSQDLLLEEQLQLTDKPMMLERVREISTMANIHFIVQTRQDGLGDAIYTAKSFVGKEPFAVLLGDSVIDANTPAMKQLVDAAKETHAMTIGAERVEKNLVSRYGVFDIKRSNERLHEMSDIVEKPKLEEAPSNLVVAGRYVLTNAVFQCLEALPRNGREEIQLTDALRLVLQKELGYGYEFAGKRYDIGNKLDFIRAAMAFGLKDQEIQGKLIREMKTHADSKYGSGQ